MSDSLVATTNPLLECTAHLFTLVMPLRAGGSDAPDDLYEQVLNGFDLFERLAFERQIPTADVQNAKFAIAAFIDEAVMASSWARRMEWMSQPLQLKLFGEHLGAKHFSSSWESCASVVSRTCTFSNCITSVCNWGLKASTSYAAWNS